MKAKDKIYDIANAALRGASLTMEEIETVSKVSPMALIADHGFAIEEAHMIINNMTIQARKHRALGFKSKPLKEGNRGRLSVKSFATRNSSINEEIDFKNLALDATGLALDFVGIIPGYGEIADFANFQLALSRGNYLGAAFSFISMIPEIGDIVGKGGKAIVWVDKYLGKDTAKSALSVVLHVIDLAKAIKEHKSKIDGFFKLAEGALGENVPKMVKALDDFLEKYLPISESKRYRNTESAPARKVVNRDKLFERDEWSDEQLGFRSEASKIKALPGQLKKALEAILGNPELLLDIIGLIPGFGEPADAANGFLALYKQDFLGAALSFLSVFPEVGVAVGKGGKLMVKAESYFGKASVKMFLAELPRVKELAKSLKDEKGKIDNYFKTLEGIEKIKPYVPEMKKALVGFVQEYFPDAAAPAEAGSTPKPLPSSGASGPSGGSGRFGGPTTESKRISRLPAHLQGPLRKALIECGCQDAEEPEMSFPFPAPQMSSYHPVETDDGLQFEDSDAYEESGMIKSNLYSIASKAQSLHDMVEDGDDLPEWVQEKIAVCDEYMDVIQDYLKYEYKTTGGHLGRSKSK